MNMRFKLAIDHYVGGVLARLLNLGARLAAVFIRRDHTFSKPPRSILFLKFTGMGSIARAAFLVEAARKKYPDATIGFATFSACTGLAKLYPQIDQVLVVRDRGLIPLALDTLRVIFWSWKNHVDLVVDLEVHSKYSSVLTGLTLARDRAGFGGVTSRFRRGLYTHLVFWNPTRRVDLAYRQLGRAIGCDSSPHWVKPQVPIAAEQEVDRLLTRLQIRPTDTLFGVNPNSSDLAVERLWPTEHFAATVRSLEPNETLQVLLLGSPKEREHVEQVRNSIGNALVKVHNIAGELSLAGYVALLGRLRVLLTNDSGPLHIAAALGTPTISLWGPTHPAHYAPHGSKHLHFYRPLYCSPCVHTTDHPPCGGDNQCMKRLGWERVAEAVRNTLADAEVRPHSLVIRTMPVGTVEPVHGYWQRESVKLPVVSGESK